MGNLPMVWLFILSLAVMLIIAARLWRIQRHNRCTPRDPDRLVSEVSELAGGLAHEIRNPLSTLLVNLKLLAEDLEAAEDIDSDIKRRSLRRIGSIRNEAERLEQLLGDFLHLVGPFELRRQETDLNNSVRNLVDFFTPQAEQSGVRIRAGYASGPLRANVDARLIEQALLNLVLNATQAMPEGGEIIIRCYSESAKTAVIEICDTGPGIPLEDQEKIFKPFYSTRVGGTGLGLSTTQRIIHEHGGSIQLESEPGQGTRFLIRIPTANEFDLASRHT
jgi:signal transduction histidine kinase